MACSWFVAVASQFAQNLGLLGAFLGRFRDTWWSSSAAKGSLTRESQARTWSVPTLSLCLAVSNGFQGYFGPKMAVFGPKLQFLKLRCATCDTRSRPPPLSFWLVLCVVVPHSHRYHPPKFQPNPKHHDGVLNFCHFTRAACCLVLLAAAAAAKPGRSTLDHKKGYKTKTGSTSLVTLTLIKAEYLDRAGGGGNISYDW